MKSWGESDLEEPCVRSQEMDVAVANTRLLYRTCHMMHVCMIFWVHVQESFSCMDRHITRSLLFHFLRLIHCICHAWIAKMKGLFLRIHGTWANGEVMNTFFIRKFNILLNYSLILFMSTKRHEPLILWNEDNTKYRQLRNHLVHGNLKWMWGLIPTFL